MECVRAKSDLKRTKQETIVKSRWETSSVRLNWNGAELKKSFGHRPEIDQINIEWMGEGMLEVVHKRETKGDYKVWIWDELKRKAPHLSFL